MKKRDIIFEALLSLLIVFLFFGADWRLEYATDTYAIYMGDWSSVVDDFTFRSGRPMIGLFFSFLFSFHPSLQVIYFLSFSLGIVCLSLAVYLYQGQLKEVGISKFPRFLCTTAIYISPFIIEYFMFLEKGMFCFAILLCTISFLFFLRYLTIKNRIYELLSICFLIMVAFTYQGIVAFFFPLVLPFIFLYMDGVKTMCKNIFVALLNFGISGISSVIFLRVVGNSERTQTMFISWKNMFETGKQILRCFITSMNILPRGIYVFLCVLVFMFIFWEIKRQKKNVGLRISYLIIEMVLIILCSTVTCMLGVSGFAPRVIFPLGTCAATMLVYYEINVRSCEKKNIISEKTLQGLFLLFLLVEFISFQGIIIAKYKVAALDENRIRLIEEEIKEYENRSDKKIEYISFYKEDLDINQYPELFYSGDMVVSSFSTDWSDLSAINYYLCSEYKKGIPDEHIQIQLDAMEESKIYRIKYLFMDNTMHLRVY